MVLQKYIDVDGSDVSNSVALENPDKIINHGHCIGQLFSVCLFYYIRLQFQIINFYEKYYFFNYLSNNQADDLIVRLAEPCQLQSKPDTKTLVFGKQFTDHMLKISWRKNHGGWQPPEITPLENLVIHPAANVFHYAVEVSIFHTQFYVDSNHMNMQA